MMLNKLTPGETATIKNKVTERRTEKTLAENAGETFPLVLATPYLIGDLERACARMLVFFGDMVQFIGGNIIAKAIAAIICEPQLPGLGVPVESDRISDASGDYFDVAVC